MFLRHICRKLNNLQVEKCFPVKCFDRLGKTRVFSSGFKISDNKIQKYLQNLSNEFYILKVSDNIGNLGRKRLTALSHLVEIYEQRKCVITNINSLKEIEDEKDEDMIKLMEEEKQVYKKLLEKLDINLTSAMLEISETEDYSTLVLEVTAGVGGIEAMLFAREIFDMYCNYIEYKGWDSEILQNDHTDAGGIRHASIEVTGDNAYQFLKHEGGVHRVQRIPVTEKYGRVHTSTVTVAIIPRPDNLNLNIKDKDLRIETKRASGAGGQHVNTTDSAVRIVHIPSGIMVECQSERSQFKNKEIAMKKLETILIQQYMDKNQTSENERRKLQVGSSLRNEKIRTYNFNQDRITDHRVEGGTTYNLKVFLDGGWDLDQLICQVTSASQHKVLMGIINNTK